MSLSGLILGGTRLRVTLWSEGRGLCYHRLTCSKEQLSFHHKQGESFTTSQIQQPYCTVQTWALSSHLIITNSLTLLKPTKKQTKTERKL